MAIDHTTLVGYTKLSKRNITNVMRSEVIQQNRCHIRPLYSCQNILTYCKGTPLTSYRLMHLSGCMLQDSRSISVSIYMEWPQEHQIGDQPRTGPCSGSVIISNTRTSSRSTSSSNNYFVSVSIKGLQSNVKTLWVF